MRASHEVENHAADEAGIRVSVRTSVSEAGLYVVRRLQPGQAVPPGTTEALLVFSPAESSNKSSAGK
jgi:hypothetical protein